MEAVAVIVLVLSTVVTSSVVVHCLLQPILERNEYYASEKRERERESKNHGEFCVCFLWYSSILILLLDLDP